MNAENSIVLDKPIWTNRRRVVIISLLFIAGNLEYIIIKGTDSALYSQLGLGLLGAGVTIIGSYVFGAAWSDNHFNTTLAAAQGVQVNPQLQTQTTLITIPKPTKAKIAESDNDKARADNAIPPAKPEDDE